MSAYSRRKSRKPESVVFPLPQASHTSTPPTHTPEHSEMRHQRQSSVSSSAGRRSVHDRPPTPPGPGGLGAAHKRKPSADIPLDSPLPLLPSTFSTPGRGSSPEQNRPTPPKKSLDAGIPTKKSFDNTRSYDALKAPGAPNWKMGKRVSAATSLAPSGGHYAGSLYDMYLGEYGSASWPLFRMLIFCDSLQTTMRKTSIAHHRKCRPSRSSICAPLQASSPRTTSKSRRGRTAVSFGKVSAFG